jgi:hypothetical protein
MGGIRPAHRREQLPSFRTPAEQCALIDTELTETTDLSDLVRLDFVGLLKKLIKLSSKVRSHGPAPAIHTDQRCYASRMEIGRRQHGRSDMGRRRDVPWRCRQQCSVE